MQICEYYDSMTPEEWKPVLGEELNFHFGYYEDGTSFEEGLRFATRRLVRHFGEGRRVLDLGCGWGGPALELTRAGYDVLCVTNSRSQYEYCKSLKLATSLLDMEANDIRQLGFFETVFMMESLDHIFDKPALLSKLTQCTNRLVFVTSCCAVSLDSPVTTYGNTMYMASTDLLLRMLEKAGWQVRFAADVRNFAMPTFAHWTTRIEAVDPTISKPPLQLLHSLCEVALNDMARFEQAFPLLTVCAEPGGASK